MKLMITPLSALTTKRKHYSILSMPTKHSSLFIRKANLEDAHLVAQLGAQTFQETYGDSHRPEDMAVYLKQAFHIEKISAQLQDPRIAFFIAFLHKKAVGYTKSISKENPPGEKLGKKAIELERIYVTKDMVGKKIGQALMQTALAFSKNTGHDVIWLSVWEHNPRAVTFYEKFGFKIFGQCHFVLGQTTRHNFLMEKSL